MSVAVRAKNTDNDLDRLINFVKFLFISSY